MFTHEPTGAVQAALLADAFALVESARVQDDAPISLTYFEIIKSLFHNFNLFL